MERAPIERSQEFQNKNPELALAGEHQYQILNSPEMRMEYLKLTDELIGRMVEQGTDLAIFLDKSGRPVAWQVKDLWPILAPVNPETGEQYKLPEIKFLNIDREQWGALLGRSEDTVGGIDVRMLPRERLVELKQIFAPVAGMSKEGDTSLLTGKKVMVVDELKQSGDTLDMAERIIAKTFPDAAEVKSSYWMIGKVERDPTSGALVGKDGPVWYSDTEVTGRLVGNRDTSKSMQSNSSRQRVGRYWLSARFRNPDLKGRQLKQETKWLAEDLRNHKIIYMPSTIWGSDSVEPAGDRIKRINNISVEEFVDLRRKTGQGAARELVRKYVELVSAKE